MAKFQIDILTAEEMREIKDATFRLLERTGVKIYSPEALALLKEAGAAMEGTLVKIDRSLAERCLRSAPERIDIYDRDGALAMELFDRNSYFGPGVTCPYFNDPYTLERKKATKEHVAAVAKVADGLEHVDFLMSLCMISDETPQLADVHEIHAMMQNSKKPILSWAFDVENMKYIVKMAAAAVGGEEQLREKSYLLAYAEPTTPLVHSRDALEKLMFLAANDIPCVYSPGMTFGGTAPVTLAGALTVGLADVITGIVISQLVKPGAPIICSSDGGVLDMRTFQSAYGSPEMSLVDAAGTQILRSFGIPSFGLAGATDAKCLDAQAAMEVTTEIIFSLGAGANLIHDLGMMDVGMTGSIHLMTFCNEVIAFTKRLRRGIMVNEETLAADAINEVGPNGNFLASEHTMRHFREEMYVPELGLRKQYAAWVADGEKTMADLTREKVIRLLENHQPVPLEAEKLEKLAAIVAEAEKRFQ